MQKNLLEDLRLVITSLGVGKMLQSLLTPLLRFLKSHTRRSFSSFSSLATNPAGEIHRAHSFAGILSMTPCLISFWTSFFTFSFQCSGFLQGLQVKNGFVPGNNFTLIGGHVIICLLSNSSTRTSSNSLQRSCNSFGHSCFGHSGIFGSGAFVFGLNLLGVEGTSVKVAEFALKRRTKGQPLCKRFNFFCVIHEHRKLWERFGHTSAMVSM